MAAGREWKEIMPTEPDHVGFLNSKDFKFILRWKTLERFFQGKDMI